MAESQDHKPVWEWDIWENTWGMWAYSWVDHLMTPELRTQIMKEIIQPTIDGIKQRWMKFKWFLYAWLKLTEDWPKLLEYNVRFWDPETQPVLMRLKSDFLEMCLAWAEWRLDEVNDVIWDTRKAVWVVLAWMNYPTSWSKWVLMKLPQLYWNDAKIV